MLSFKCKMKKPEDRIEKVGIENEESEVRSHDKT